MRSFFGLLVVLVVAVSYGQSQSVEPECHCNLNNLWLDVYLVIDDSTKMGESGLSQVTSNVVSLFSYSRIGTYPDKRGVRVALITYNTVASIRSNFSDFKSNQDLTDMVSNLKVSNSDVSSIQEPLKLINTMLEYKDQNGPKNNTQTLIIMYAADYVDYGQPTADQLAYYMKENDMTIITVGNINDGDRIAKLKALASDDDGFSLTDESLTSEIQKALCYANCFCPHHYQHFMVTNNGTTHKYGSCIENIIVQKHWSEFKLYCQNRDKQGYLATEYTIEKALFMQALFDGQLRNYHIGLHYVNGGYYWEQKYGMPLIPLANQLYPLDKFPAAGAQCVGNTVADNRKFESWKNENCYNDMKGAMCETLACDTENYCN